MIWYDLGCLLAFICFDLLGCFVGSSGLWFINVERRSSKARRERELIQVLDSGYAVETSNLKLNDLDSHGS
jgi:hypothetical protein